MGLPKHFPQDLKFISPTNLQRVETFYWQFVENKFEEYVIGHYLLAAYAAVPGYLTPDLLYQIWQNFSGYIFREERKNIDRIAVSDVLLSDLCKPIGFEIYQMHEEIRNGFLKWLTDIEVDDASVWKNRQIAEKKVIADFLTKYYKLPNSRHARWGSSFIKFQKNEALSIVDPKGSLTDHIDVISNYGSSDVQKLKSIDIILKRNIRFRMLTGPNNKEDDDPTIVALEKLKSLILDDAEPSVTEKNAKYNENEIIVPTTRQGHLHAFVVRLESRFINKNLPDKVANALGKKYKNISKYFNLDQYKFLTGKNATKQLICKNLEDLGKHCKKMDDLVIYLAGISLVAEDGLTKICCSDSEPENLSTWLCSSDIKKFTDACEAYSITVILECDYSATTDWMDLSRPGRVIFARCKSSVEIKEGVRNESDYDPKFKLETSKSNDLFTERIIDILLKSNFIATNRSLYARLIEIYHNGEYPQNSETLPQLLCSQNSYGDFFLQRNNQRLQLQNLLRTHGFYHAPSVNNWTTDMVEALMKAQKELSMVNDATKLHYIEELEKASSKTSFGSSVLLIFSNPEDKLKMMKEEMDEINEMLLSAGVLFTQLINVTKRELRDYLESPGNRNCVQLIYFSGQDDGQGNFLLNNRESFSLEDLASALDYQQHVKLLVSNTCKSSQFCKAATQMGIAMAIGSTQDQLQDQDASRFGIQIMDHIVHKQLGVGDFLKTYNEYST